MPLDLALTGQVPDLALIDRSVTPTRVLLLELTVPWDSTSSFKAAFDRKYERYEQLTEDLKSSGFNTLNMPLEIDCRGRGATAASLPLSAQWSASGASRSCEGP